MLVYSQYPKLPYRYRRCGSSALCLRSWKNLRVVLDSLRAEFDHTCPWTGTGIGKRNLGYFHVFTASCCLLLVYIIFVAALVILF